MTATPEAPPISRRLDSLTGMRFLAALLVFFHHTFAPSIVPRGVARGPEAVRTLAEVGLVGVTFFFVLSGFVLTWSWQPAGGTRPFYARRFARVWPLHALCWLAAITIMLPVLGKPQPSVPQDLAVLTFLHAWIPDPNWYFAGDGPSWSLSCEAFFYAMLPLVLPRAVRWGRRAAYGVVLAAMVILAVAPLLVRALATDLYALLSLWVFPPYRAAEFAIGVVLGLAMRSGWRPSWGPLPALAAVVVAYIASAVLLHDYFQGPSRFDKPLGQLYAGVLVVLPVTALIAAVAARDIAARATWLSTRTAVKLGDASYAFYLVHAMVILVVVHEAPGLRTPVRGLVALLVVFGISLGLSLLLHRFVERPADRWLRRRLGATRPG